MNMIQIRLAEDKDIPALCKLLNDIILVGGTTANQTPFSEDEFGKHFLYRPSLICCHTALDKQEIPAGFQMLNRHADLPNDWADIATFARLEPKLKGVGTALFNPTKQLAKQSGFTTLNATIRADNTGGLAYYEKLGFETYSVDKAIPLDDGTKIDRISKLLLIKQS